jgi:hypothetical protein
MSCLNYPRIELWKQDILASVRDTEFPRFNMNYEIIEGKRGRTYEGDAALFLAFRYAAAENLFDWYYDQKSHEIVELFTGIPQGDAYRLLNPPYKHFDYDKIKPAEFVAVLDSYLLTSHVSWHTLKEAKDALA